MIGIEKVWCRTPFNRNRKFVQNYYGLQHEFIIVSDPGQAEKKSGDFLFFERSTRRLLIFTYARCLDFETNSGESCRINVRPAARLTAPTRARSRTVMTVTGHCWYRPSAQLLAMAARWGVAQLLSTTTGEVPGCHGRHTQLLSTWVERVMACSCTRARVEVWVCAVSGGRRRVCVRRERRTYVSDGSAYMVPGHCRNDVHLSNAKYR
jgi:hypothetical protein